MTKSILTLGVAALALALAGCGGGGDDHADRERRRAAHRRSPAPNNGDWTQIVTRRPRAATGWAIPTRR